jgi:N-methylhydantoinase B
MEQRYPLRLLRHSLREDSGGRGEFRGGLGIVRVYQTLEACRLSLWFERAATPSWGLRGGADGAPPEVWVTPPGNQPRLIRKCNALAVPAGTIVEVFTGGGGGWGDPVARTEERLLEDERLGLASRQ